MAVKIGHASIGENGKVTGGQAGDQTGKEVKISNYYVHSKGWVVLRCKDKAKRNKIAEAMEMPFKNDSIGYDQNQRDTLYNNVKNSGYDPSKTTKKVETDCSALVRVCIAYAYGEDVAGNIRTISQPAELVKTGLFTKYTADKYCRSSDYLVRGDILCTPVSGHTVVVLNDGAKAEVKDEQEGMVDVKVSVLKKGTKGDQVKALQTLLIGYGYSCGKSGVDGSFGAATENAVKAYQNYNGLEVDGSVGSATWSKLLGV